MSATEETTTLSTLFGVSSVLCRSASPIPALSEVLNLIAARGQAAWGQIALSAVGTDVDLERAAFYSALTPAVGESPVAMQSPATQWIVENDRSLVTKVVGPDARFEGERAIYDRTLSYVGVPIRNSLGQVVGVLEVQPRVGEGGVAEVAALCEMAAELVGQHNGANWPSRGSAGASGPPGERGNYGFENLVGQTPTMRQIFSQIRQVAKWNTTVLILGESGTGKELIANAIHFNSPRARGPFVKLNCAALPDNLLESELFGHEKGAFTGALTRHTGRFEQAHRGTLFLDEIGEISPSFQAKLLRVLQEGEYERLGGTQTIRVDVRVIAATNRDLEQQVEENKFRQDLFYRLNVMPIFTPALRERKEDIGDLAEYLAKKIGKAQGRELRVTDSAVRALTLHDWPGNVRELENCLERAAIMSDSEVIDRDAVLRAGVGLERTTHAPVSGAPPTIDLRDPNVDERERVLAALERAGWVQAKAARLLGMTPRQVAYRIQILRIEVPRF